VIFGGTNSNNDKLNDLWFFDGAKWSQKIATNAADGTPEERSGHQITIYQNRYVVVFGGMQEVTNELNDLHVYDLDQNIWHEIENDNKNASASGSPKNKGAIQQSDSFKKNTLNLNMSSNPKYANRLANNTQSNFN